MNYQQFLHETKTIVEQLLGDNYHIEIYSTLKNNNKERTGLAISEIESNISPTIYLEEFYNEYVQEQDLLSIAETIVDLYKEIKLEQEWIPSCVKDFDTAKSTLVYRIINTSQNTDFLSRVPHKSICDFSIIFFLLLKIEENNNATMIITNEIMNYWNVSLEELYEVASSNMPTLLPANFQPMHILLQELMGCDIMEIPESKQMYVLTNPIRTYGAACIFYPGMLEKIWSELKEDYYLIPGSIHEMLIIPLSVSPEKERLEEMLWDVNETQNPLEDVLSDRVYYYNHEFQLLL